MKSVLAVSLIVGTPFSIEAFSPSLQHGFSTTLHSSAVAPESERLKKARSLLQEITTKSEGEAIPGLDEDSTDNIVPDTYWRNGHLGSEKYVTRWAAGVKVAEPLVTYDPVVAEKLLFRQPAKWLLRNVQIALPMGLWAFGVATDFVLRDSTKRTLRAKQLTKAISSLGPAIIKGGQALASRPDLLPAEYLRELQTLQDSVPTFSNEVALRTVEQELGIERFDDIFELEQQEPIAAASIGQVYKARLRETGETVALKIQRPGCEEIIALDLYVLRWWSGVYNKIFEIFNRDIDLQLVIDDFGELIYREIGKSA